MFASLQLVLLSLNEAGRPSFKPNKQGLRVSPCSTSITWNHHTAFSILLASQRNHPRHPTSPKYSIHTYPTKQFRCIEEYTALMQVSTKAYFYWALHTCDEKHNIIRRKLYKSSPGAHIHTDNPYIANVTIGISCSTGVMPSWLYCQFMWTLQFYSRFSLP